MVHKIYYGLDEGTSRLQRRLENMPLVPQDSATRKRRDKLVSQLMESARRHGCVERVNFVAGVVR
jgi:hypothetical protein